MSVTKLTCSKTDGVSIELPKGFIRQPLTGVNVTEDYSNRYIQGFISERWALQNRKKLPSLLKFTLDEKNGSTQPSSNTISVFCFGEIAREMDQIKKGDLLVIAGFTVEQATRPESSHVCQLCVDNSKQEVQVWIVNVDTKEEPSTSGVVPSRKETKVKRKIVNVDTKEEPSTSGVVPSRKETKVKRKPTLDYIYSNLDSLKANSSVNIYAVVKFFKPPYQTRGTDLCQILSVVDHTCEPGTKLKCLFFIRPPSEAPPVQIGSIIRFHRLKVINHNGAFQGNNGPGFSWLVFEGQEGASMEPKSSSANFTITDKDKQKVEKLRKWSASHDEINDVTKSTTLSDIIPGKYINVSVQVVSTCAVEHGVCFLLRVWDGTKSIYPVREVQPDPDNTVVDSDDMLLEAAQGMLYDVCLFDNHFKTGATIKPGDVVELRNLHAAVYKNTETREEYNQLQTVELAIHRGTSYGRGVVKVSPGNTTVTELVKRLDEIKENFRQNVTADLNQNHENNNNNPGTSGNVSAMVTETLHNSDSKSKEKQSNKSSENIDCPDVLGLNQSKTIKRKVKNVESSTKDTKDEDRKRQRGPEIEDTGENVGFDFKTCAQMKDPALKKLKESSDVRVQKINSSNSNTLTMSEKDGGKGAVESAGFEFPNNLNDSNNCQPSTMNDNEIQFGQNGFQNGCSSPELQLSCDPVSDLGSQRSPEANRCMMETATVVTAHHHIQPVALSEVITHAVPYKFRILAKLMDYKPKLENPRDLIKLFCAACNFMCAPPKEDDDSLTSMICPRCLESSPSPERPDMPTLEHVYLAKFLLDDGKDNIEANLWREDAITFFGGVKPEEVLSEVKCFKAIREDLERLSGTEDSKPWLECCIKSYTGPARTCYQIFDTTIA